MVEKPREAAGRRVCRGDRKWSFTMQPCGRDGKPINGGNHYADADTLEGARSWARKVLAKPGGRHLDYPVRSVAISGCVHEFRGDGWFPLVGREGRSHHEVVESGQPGPSGRTSVPLL